jgi:type III secretory pathway component EscT
MAWARATPAVTLVPAFGLKALPTASRAVLAIALAATVFPALPPVTGHGQSLSVGLVSEAIRGVPVAIAAAIPLWAATMAGDLADALRGSQETGESPTVEGSATPTGIAFSLLACSFFFATGGPARIASALVTADVQGRAVLRATVDLSEGITIAVAIAAPLLAASVVVEVAGALVARAATPAQLHLVLAPLRALALLAVLAVVWPGMAGAIAVAVAHAPR